jgi:hypothetical protein
MEDRDGGSAHVAGLNSAIRNPRGTLRCQVETTSSGCLTKRMSLAKAPTLPNVALIPV